jgi:Protein of unknown function (DUF2637)
MRLDWQGEGRPVLLPQLRRIRWAVRATLVLGVAASVVANVLHALDNPISQAIAAWPPCALLLTVELISRVPVHRRSLAFARLLATAIIAGIAAWVSYWHMAGVAARYGETGASPYLLPLSVDGLIVVASICLVELGGRITSLEAEAVEATHAAQSMAAQSAAAQSAAVAARAAAVAPALPSQEAEPAVPGLIPMPGGTPAHAAASAGVPAQPSGRVTAAALAEAAAALRTATAQPGPMAAAAARVNGRGGATAELPVYAPTMTRQQRGAATPKTVTGGGGHTSARGAAPVPTGAPSSRTEKGPKARRTPAETVALAARIKAERPEVSETELAAALGISPSRWRTVRREAEDVRLAA